MKVHQAKSEHEIVYHELTALLSRHAGKVSAPELLAVAANMVGKLIAMQDQRTMRPDVAMEIVTRNIELGNQQAIEALSKPRGHA